MDKAALCITVLHQPALPCTTLYLVQKEAHLRNPMHCLQPRKPLLACQYLSILFSQPPAQSTNLSPEGVPILQVLAGSSRREVTITATSRRSAWNTASSICRRMQSDQPCASLLWPAASAAHSTSAPKT